MLMNIINKKPNRRACKLSTNLIILKTIYTVNTGILTEQKLISDCRYRVIESSSLVPVLFGEVFSHPYISFFHLLVNGFSVIFFSNEFRKTPLSSFIKVGIPSAILIGGVCLNLFSTLTFGSLTKNVVALSYSLN